MNSDVKQIKKTSNAKSLKYIPKSSKTKSSKPKSSKPKSSKPKSSKPKSSKTKPLKSKSLKSKSLKSKSLKSKSLKSKSLNPPKLIDNLLNNTPRKESLIINLDNVNSSVVCNTSEKMYKKYLGYLIKSHEANKILTESKDYLLKVCNGNGLYSLFFTSGALESNILFLYSTVNAYKKLRKITPHVVMSSVENESIIKYANSLKDSGQIDLTFIRPNIYGCILSDHITQALKPNTCCVLITYINQELGSVNNIQKISSILHEKRVPLHSDCSNLFGKHKLDLLKTNMDAATISFNKINGPIGIGAIIIKNSLIDGYKLYEHSTILENKGDINIPAILSSIESVKYTLINRNVKNATLLKFRNEIIDKLGKTSEMLLYSDYINSDEAPLGNKNKIIILGPPVSNESYYTPNILSLLIKSKSNISAVDIKIALEKKNIIIGVPTVDSIMIYDDIKMKKNDQKFVIRISFSDHIIHTNINTFIIELQKII
jgi:cysteine sulfinate desulfinase/cysteine desulfurase-like protein